LGGADVHTENIRVGIDRDAEGKPMLRVQFVGDFEDFVKKHASTKYWISSSIAIGAEMLAGKGPKEILQTFVGQLITGFVFFGMWDTVDYYTFFMSPLKYKGLSYLSLSPFEITSLYHTASVELSQNRSLTDRLIDIIPRSIGTGFVFSGVAFSKVMADKTGGGILDVHKIKKTLSGQLAKIMHTANGGIDLSAANNYLQTKTDAASTAGKNGIKFYLSPSMLKQLQNAPGFTPVVVGMHPMTDIKQFLGIENS